MKRSTFLATAALSLASLFAPRKAKATAPGAEVTPTPTPGNPSLFMGVDYGRYDATFSHMVKRPDGQWEQVAVGHWPNTPRPATLPETPRCVICNGLGVVLCHDFTRPDSVDWYEACFCCPFARHFGATEADMRQFIADMSAKGIGIIRPANL